MQITQQTAGEKATLLKAKTNSTMSSYSNVYKYWNNFLIKGKLPTYDWIIDNIFNAGNAGAGIFSTCSELPIFQFYSREFIDFLAESIKSIKAGKIIEVGAGDGFLSYFLKENGIDIHPTDDYSRPDIDHPERVEKLSHKEALKKYNPDLVVISWEERGADYTIDILKYPSVKHVIWIGENEGHVSGSEKLWNYRNENTCNPYCLARGDLMLFFHSISKHAGVWIFYPEKNLR